MGSTWQQSGIKPQSTLSTAAAAQIGVDRLRAVCDHVERHIKTSKTTNHAVDDQMDALVINLRDDSSDSSDNADEL